MPELESVVCRDYYMHLKAPSSLEDPCKAEEVQVRLSRLHGWLDQFTLAEGMVAARSVLPDTAEASRTGLLLNLPYTWVAKRIGKKALLNIGFLFSSLAMSWFFWVCK